MPGGGDRGAGSADLQLILQKRIVFPLKVVYTIAIPNQWGGTAMKSTMSFVLKLVGLVMALLGAMILLDVFPGL